MMKKTLSLVSIVLITGLVCLTSCEKGNLGDGSQFFATMEQCANQHDKTVLNGSVLNWTFSDQVLIYGTAGSALYIAQPQNPATNAVFNNVSGHSGEAPYYAIYPADIATATNAVILPATQVTEDGSLTGYPMYAESTDNHLSFKNLCGLLKLHLTKSNTSISSIVITANSEINGNYNVNYNNGNPTLSYVSDGSNSTTLTCSTAQSIDNGADFYIYLPAGNYSSLSIAITNGQGMTCTKSSNEGTTFNVYRSQYTAIAFSENDLLFVAEEPELEGALSGLFTVNANGDQVRFSQGNLQYRASTNTWRFAEHQYDYVGTQIADGDGYYGGTVNGSDNHNISSTYSGWIDLFGWGTSGWNSGANCYQPWSISISESDYWTGGSRSNSLTGAYAEADWAWHNAMYNGAIAAHQWRTLTQSEWYYLLYSRTDASDKCGTGNINGVGGLIIMPDSWIMSSNYPFNPGFSEYDVNNWPDWSHNNYTLSQWEQMEAMGAVFLPAAGSRNGTNVGSVGLYSYYWTSTSTTDGEPFIMDFSSGGLDASSVASRYCGFSVRPVRDEE